MQSAIRQSLTVPEGTIFVTDGETTPDQPFIVVSTSPRVFDPEYQRIRNGFKSGAVDVICQQYSLTGYLKELDNPGFLPHDAPIQI